MSHEVGRSSFPSSGLTVVVVFLVVVVVLLVVVVVGRVVVGLVAIKIVYFLVKNVLNIIFI